MGCGPLTCQRVIISVLLCMSSAFGMRELADAVVPEEMRDVPVRAAPVQQLHALEVVLQHDDVQRDLVP